MFCIALRGHCDIIVLNLRAPTEDKSNDTKDTSFKELGHVFDQFYKYDMNIL